MEDYDGGLQQLQQNLLLIKRDVSLLQDNVEGSHEILLERLAQVADFLKSVAVIFGMNKDAMQVILTTMTDTNEFVARIGGVIAKINELERILIDVKNRVCKLEDSHK